MLVQGRAWLLSRVTQMVGVQLLQLPNLLRRLRCHGWRPPTSSAWRGEAGARGRGRGRGWLVERNQLVSAHERRQFTLRPFALTPRRYKQQLGVPDLTVGRSERDVLTQRWCQPSLRCVYARRLACIGAGVLLMTVTAWRHGMQHQVQRTCPSDPPCPTHLAVWWMCGWAPPRSRPTWRTTASAPHASQSSPRRR